MMDDLTQTGTGCFIAVSIWQHHKPIRSNQPSTICEMVKYLWAA